MTSGDDDLGGLVVPRVLHRIWLGGAIPPESERFWERWGQLHPDWLLQTWTEANLPTLWNQQLYDDAAHLTAGNIWQLRSDIVRYELLEAYGGVYVDCDLEPLRNIEPLCTTSCFAAWETQGVWVNNALLGATAEHPFIGALVTELAASVDANRHRRPNHASGPRYVTRMHVARRGELHVHDQALVYPYRWDELERRDEDFPDAYTVHHWANARRSIAAT